MLPLQMVWEALEESWASPGGCHQHDHIAAELKAPRWFLVLIITPTRPTGSSESSALGWFPCMSYHLEASIYHFPYLVF